MRSATCASAAPRSAWCGCETIRPYPTERVKDVLSKFKVVGVIETNMGLGSVSSGGSLYAEACAALYESANGRSSFRSWPAWAVRRSC